MTKSRDGKYCPRCRTMAVRDQALCAGCGHGFSSGLETPLADADRHRTMQFTLPPLTSRRPDLEPKGAPERPDSRRGLLLGVGLAAVAVAGVSAMMWNARAARVAPPSPVGVWETTLPGQSPEATRLGLVLQNGGTGAFSWTAGGPSVASGQMPLRWNLDPDGRLVLTGRPPSGGGAASRTVLAVFSAHPWQWRVDRAGHRFILGTLTFQEKT